MGRNSIKSFLYSGIAFLLILTFQNCGSPLTGINDNDSLQNKQIGTLEGNGEGYGGKASYVNYDTDGQCSSDKSKIKSRIEIIYGKQFLTRQNCKDIAPVEIRAEIAEHNKKFAIYSKALFEKEDNQGISEILCRGESYDDIEQQVEVADAFVREIGGELFASISLGIYKDGVLVKSKNVEDIPVNSNVTPRGSTHYFGREFENAFILDVEQDLTATLHSLELKKLFSGPPSGTAPSPQDMEKPVIIENLECIKHN